MFLVDDDVDDSDYFYDWDAHPPRKYNTFWTDDRVQVLTEMYIKGRNTNAIARKLKTTKGAVIGKANRLFLVHGSDPEYIEREA